MIFPTQAGGVTLLRRTGPTWRDGHAETLLSGGPYIAQSRSGQSWSLYAPIGTDVHAGDRLRDHHGILYELTDEPALWQSPWTGTPLGLDAPVARDPLLSLTSRCEIRLVSEWAEEWGHSVFRPGPVAIGWRGETAIPCTVIDEQTMPKDVPVGSQDITTRRLRVTLPWDTDPGDLTGLVLHILGAPDTLLVGADLLIQAEMPGVPLARVVTAALNLTPPSA